MPRKRSTGSRFLLGAPYDEMLDDFCAAMLGSSATEVVRLAVRDFILRELQRNPGIRERYEEARSARSAEQRARIGLVRRGDDPAQ